LAHAKTTKTNLTGTYLTSRGFLIVVEACWKQAAEYAAIPPRGIKIGDRHLKVAGKLPRKDLMQVVDL